MTDHSPMRNEDVQRLEEKYLVGRNETRSCRVCVKVLYLPTSHNRTLEAFRTSTVATNTIMEMGTHNDGLRGWFAKVAIEP